MCLTRVKMTRKLTEEETLKLVQLYREHECLWDVRREAYKNKQARLTALRRIRDEMVIKGLNIDEIRTKIKIIRSTYYLELNKIEKSARSGSVYVPRVKWFNELHSFIKTVASRRTIPIIKEINEVNDPGPSENQIVNQVEQHLASSSTFTPPLRVKRKLSQRAALVKSLKNMHYETPRKDEDNDYDLFGKSVLSQLKKLSDEQAAIAQESIQSILTQCKLADIRAKKNSAFSFQNSVFSQPMHATQFNQSSYQPNQPIKCSPPESSPSGNTSSFSMGFHQHDNADSSSSQYNNESIDENA